MADVRIDAHDGGIFYAYLAAPRSAKGPGLVVCQEIFGVNGVMREVCDGFAAQGFFAICPDLFWRQQPGIQLTDRTEAEWQRAFELYKGFDEAKGVEDLKSTLKFVHAVNGCTGKAGAVGYCLGGKLAYLMATRSTSDASVGYYGVGIDAALGEAARITKPLMLHIAENDSYCPPDAQKQIRAALSANRLVTLHSYPGAEHAFARTGGEHFDAQCAELANRRTADFLRAHLV